MAPAKKSRKEITSYAHTDEQRVNNPPVGLVTPESDKDGDKRSYAYDPHLDPQLVWAGKAERTSFELPTVSLHVHERIDPRTIIEAVRRRNGNSDPQLSLFSLPEENPPLRQAIEFYQHEHNWSNRLIAGDSLLVMNSLIEKEGMAGKVQMIYIDPPYGIKYGSNFQPFVNRRNVKDGKDDDLTSEPEQIRAFRDTWELGIHSYLSYMRDRLLLSRELLTESGSVFVQISDENVHLVRNLLDEIFGTENFAGLIVVRKTGGLGSGGLTAVADFVLWYCRSIVKKKYRKLFLDKIESGVSNQYRYARLPSGEDVSITDRTNLPTGSKIFSPTSLHTMYAGVESCLYSFNVNGKAFSLPPNRQWSTTLPNMKRLIAAGRVYSKGNTPRLFVFSGIFQYPRSVHFGQT